LIEEMEALGFEPYLQPELPACILATFREPRERWFEFEQFYNCHRPHQGIANARPLQALPPPPPPTDVDACLHIHRHDRLGGILHEYQHAALPARM